MADQVGLVGVLDLNQFNRNYRAYTSALDHMNQVTGNTVNSLNQSFLGFGSSLNRIAMILGTAVVAAAAAAGVALVKMTTDAIQQAADLEQQISNIASVLNMTNDEAGFLKDVIIDLGLDPTLRVTTFEAAEAIELLAKNGIFAGMSLEDTEAAAMSAAKATIFLANATGAEFGQAANIATSAMTLFGLEADDLVDIVSNITAVTTNSKFTINDYELALRNGGAAASVFGVSLEDFNTVVTATADELGTGMRDGTSFANMLYRLTPNSEKAADAMRELGWVTANGSNIFYDAAGNLKGMDEITKILYDSLYGASTVMVEVGGRTAEQQKLLQDLYTEYNAATATIEEYTSGVTGMLASEEEKNKAISEAEQIMQRLYPEIQALEGIQGDYVESTQQLTAEQRMLAIETIFGRDALGAVVGLMKEGAPVVDDVRRVMDALAISEEEAFALVSSGITEYELLQKTMARTDAEENAKTRMDNLKGSMEILGGVIEAIKIEFGDQFLPVLKEIVDWFTQWLNNSQPLQEQIIATGEAVAGLVEALFKGEDPIAAFSEMLEKIAGQDIATKFENTVTAIRDFIDPIREFVEEHAEGFIGSLKAIGLAFGSLMVASAIASLLNPITALIVLVGALGFAWEENFLGIRDAVTSTIEKVTEFLDKIGLIAAFDEGGFRGIFDELPTIISNIQTELGNIDWYALYDSFIAGVAEVGAGIGEMFNSIDWGVVAETILTALGTAMATGAVLMVGTAKTIVDTLIAFITGFVTEVDWSGFVTELGGGIQRVIDNVASVLTVDNIASRIASMFTKSTGGGLAEFTGTFDKIKNVIRGVGEAFQPITSVFKAFGETVGPSFSLLWENLVKVWETSIIPLGQQLKDTFEALTPILEFLGKIIQWVAIGIGAVLYTAIQVVIGVIAGLINAIATAADSFISGFATMITGVAQFVEGVADFLTNLWNFIVGIFQGDGDKVKTAWSNMGTAIVDMISGVFLTVIGVVRGFFTTFFELIGGFVQGIIDYFVNLYEELVGHSIIPDMVNGILEWIVTLKDTFIEYIINLITDVLDNFRTFIIDMFIAAIRLKNNVLGKVRELWDEFITTVKDKTLEILTKVGEFILDIYNKFVDAKNDFIDAGASIIDGLIEGIESKLMAAIDVIKGFGQSVLDAWNDFWNTHSPSRLMMESAKNIMSGFNLGVEAEVNPTVGTFQNAADSIFSGFLTRANDLLPRGDFRNPVQNINNSRTNNINLNNNFTGSPQITDANQLELMLAGYI